MKIQISVIGQGYVGLPIAMAACEAGYQVIGIDTDHKKIEQLKSGISGLEDVSNQSVLKYLKSATSQEILSLPLIIKGQSLNDTEFDNLTSVQKDLISFFSNPSSSQPKRSVGKFNIWHEKNRKRLSEDVNKIRHWEIILGDYRDIPNQKATWFIDPPYQGNGGKYYKHGNKDMNYDELREWITSREGQVIVCENSEAEWLDFKPLKN
jgi:16S rRNA G966 N2-methylase RsmD